jgi:flagellar operon protein
MSSAMRISNYHRPVNLDEIAQRGRPGAAQGSEKASFKEMFSRELAASRDVTFSKHAGERLYSRGIELTDDQIVKISEAIDKASSKGSKETLILAENVALVVAVDNRTVITAFDRENLREGVVTSIDSAVVLD